MPGLTLESAARPHEGRGTWHNDGVERSELVAALRRMPLFATVPAAALDELVPLTHVRRLTPGMLLFSEGEPARALPLLLSGQVKLARLAADGREQVLHLVRAPASFAEAAVFGPGVFPATAEVLKGGELAEIARAELLALLHRRPEVTLAMLASLSVWLRRLVDLVEGLSLRTVEERVAGYLVSAAARGGLALEPGAQLRLEDSKRLIAAACGTAPEVLSRSFRKLALQNLLQVDGATVTILDVAALLRLARGERSGHVYPDRNESALRGRRGRQGGSPGSEGSASPCAGGGGGGLHHRQRGKRRRRLRPYRRGVG